MSSENYSIIYSSNTGNTKQLAEAIRDALPAEHCDYFGDCSIESPESELLYIGFWTNKGVADDAAMGLLQKLKGKRVFLFGTAGFGTSEEYFDGVLDRTKAALDESNTVVGAYMCQGKMPQAVRERYVRMKEQPDHPANLDMLIENFDLALTHPDANDLAKLKGMVARR